MNKSDLVDSVVEHTGMMKKDCDKVVNIIIDAIIGALAKGDRVQLVGFGTFEVRERKAREGRNPSTGETIEISATKAPVFKAGKTLKNLVK
jgi:DNA-binding protein HU-beta